MLLKKKQQPIKSIKSLSHNKRFDGFSLSFSLNVRKIFFKVMFIFLSLMCLSCRYTPQITGGSGGGVDRIGGNTGGQIIADCNQNQNPNYNACIYKKNPIAQSGVTINRSGDVLSQLTQLQTYAVQIRGTQNNLLKNSHFDITIGNTGNIGVIDTMINSIVNIDIGSLIMGQTSSYFDLKSYVVERATLSNGKWTTPYENGDYFVEQVMSYYWLMYQLEWMQENTPPFYASEKNIQISAFSSTPFEAYFSPLENKIALGLNCDIVTSNVISCDPPFGVGLSAEVIIHEAGHANSFHSVGLNRSGLESACQTHLDCKSKKSLCDLSADELPDASKCCNTEKGCYFAIDEGAADFHAAILFPSNTAVGEMFQNSTQGITGCFPNTGLSRSATDPATKSANAQQFFNSCTNHESPGEIHVMGILYNSIWWEVYKHADTEEIDILKLFTEHLPVLHFDDTFETAGVRIISLAKQLFEDPKGSQYANIIQSEFERRGLNPTSSN